MKTIIIIPSRMASERFPGKPMAKINGIPMVQRVWRQAIDSMIGDVYVACAENEIFDLVSSLGGNAILTDPDLPSGTDRIHSAFLKIKNNNSIDNVINLQGDMPLIQPEQIKKVIHPLLNNFKIGTLATTLHDHEKNNPNVTKVLIDKIKNNVGIAKEFFRIKDSIQGNVFHHVGIYSYTRDALLNFVKLPKSKNEIMLNLEQYRAMDAQLDIGVTYVSNIPFSIDTKEDLINAEIIIKDINEKN